MNILVPIILHVAIQNVFERPYCRFCKCCFRLSHCSRPIFFGRIFLVSIFENVLTVSFESFVFIPLASTVLSNKSRRTSKHFTPLLSSANLSTYARSIHQISFLNLAKALILLNLQVACVNLVYEVFECKKSLSFDRERFAAFAKLHTEQYAANRCV